MEKQSQWYRKISPQCPLIRNMDMAVYLSNVGLIRSYIRLKPGKIVKTSLCTIIEPFGVKKSTTRAEN